MNPGFQGDVVAMTHFIKTHTFSLMLGTKPQLQYYHHLLQSVIGSFTHCQLFSISVPRSTQNDRRLTNLREIYRLFHYRLDTGYISDKLSVSMEQWHIRHAMSNVVFLVLTGISLGFSSWCFEDPAILVRPFSSQVLAVQECVCVCVCTLFKGLPWRHGSTSKIKGIRK